MFPFTPRYSEDDVREALSLWYKEINESPEDSDSESSNEAKLSGDYLIKLLNRKNNKGII